MNDFLLNNLSLKCLPNDFNCPQQYGAIKDMETMRERNTSERSSNGAPRRKCLTYAMVAILLGCLQFARGCQCTNISQLACAGRDMAGERGGDQ